MLAGALVLAGPAGAARTRSPVAAPQDAIIDGPGTGVVSMNGLSIARDGTGGLVYVKQVAGVNHVFVSLLKGGSFGSPVQVDPGLAGPSSQPAIVAGNHGSVEVAFINGGALYVAQSDAGAPITPPQLLYPNAASPSLSMSNFGKAYLAFTATDGGGGGDIRTAYYYENQWALAGTPLDANPADGAGLGSGRPEVAASGDGTGLVVWGENGHIYARRVVKTAPSTAYEQADPASLDGWSEVSSGDPQVATGGDSSYASVTFQEQLSNGSSQQSRVLFNRLHAGQFDGVMQADGAPTGGPEGADQPQTSATEYGDGWALSERNQTHALYADVLGGNENPLGVERVDSLPNTAAPYAISSPAGLFSTLIAWQQTPGSTGPAEIRMRYAPDGRDMDGEQVVSDPSNGATDAAAGLGVGGDVAGDAAVAWVQGSGASTVIATRQLYMPPGAFAPSSSFAYATTATPVLSWSQSAEYWGGPTYAVHLDGVTAGQTTATSFVPSTPLFNGRHGYQITATNPAGLTASARPAVVFVDTVPPKGSFRLSGKRIIGSRLRVVARYSDPPPTGQPRSEASGVKAVYVRWGDGTTTQIRRTTAYHAYKRKRTYTITLIVTDRAGNVTVVRKKIKILRTAPRGKRRATKGKKTGGARG